MKDARGGGAVTPREGDASEGVEFDVALAAERLTLSATEQITARMVEQGITRITLADACGVSKGEISQRLNGPRNLTLGTLAEMAHAIGCRFTITLRPGVGAGAIDYATEYQTAEDR